MNKPASLDIGAFKGKGAVEVEGFIDLDEGGIKGFHAAGGFAMSLADLKFVQEYFRGEGRNPTETELKVIDTYWSDHCRHTTFLTELTDIDLGKNDEVKEGFALYREAV